MKAKRICFLSTVHFVYDGRIFQKEAHTLAAAGFDITVVAREDPTPSATNGIQVLCLPENKSRLAEILKRFQLHRALRAVQLAAIALRQQADIFTVHDPELLPVAVLLKIFKRRIVVYDIHEDVPQQILDKEWLPRSVRPWVKSIYRLVERMALLFVDGLVLAEYDYGKYYKKYNAQIVLNYPLLTYAHLYKADTPKASPRPTLVYAGTITELRGLYAMLDLVRRLKQRYGDILLRLIGPINIAPEAEKAQRLIADYDISDNVELTGRVSLEEVYRQIGASDIGLALLRPEPNYLNSFPTKLFEYMIMGKPVIVSNFPLWQKIVADAACGIAVDPLDFETILQATIQLIESEDQRAQMGKLGREAALDQYSWDSQGRQIVQFYQRLSQ